MFLTGTCVVFNPLQLKQILQQAGKEKKI